MINMTKIIHIFCDKKQEVEKRAMNWTYFTK